VKAIVIPGMNDMNKGDQALIWESVRLVEDTGLFKTVKVLVNGDTPEEMEQLCSQSRSRGIKLVYNILPHPRRGKHQEDFREGYRSQLRLVLNAVKDFMALTFLQRNLKRSTLLSLFFDQNVLHSLREFREADVVFVKGGGFIHGYGEMSAPYLMWYFLFYVRLAKKMGKKVIILPNSFGPFRGLGVRSQVKKALLGADLIYAREQQSAHELGALLKKKIPVAKDLGFFLGKGESIKLNDFLPANLQRNDLVKVGITVRPWRFPGSLQADRLFENYLNSVRSLVDNCAKKGHAVLFFNQSIGPNSHEDDRLAIAEVMKRLGENENVCWINQDFTCEELQSLYSELDFMVGTRFHSVIFSLTSGVPSLAIGYGGNKAGGIMGDFEMDEYTVPIDHLTPELLSQTFEKLSQNRERIRKKLRELPLQLQVSREKLIGEIRHQIQNN